MPHRDPVSAFLAIKEVLLPFQSDVAIDDKSFDVANDVVPGRIQIAATPPPGLFWQNSPGTMIA